MKRIALSGKHGAGKFALVDDSDFDELVAFRWYLGAGGYVRRNGWDDARGKQITILMARQIMGFPEGLEVDHIQHDKLDNRKCNIRVCTRLQNLCNSRKQRTVNGDVPSSQYKGVDWLKNNKKWRARIKGNNELIHLGCFDNEIEAARAYDAVAIEHHGEFALLNFPSELIALTA